MNFVQQLEECLRDLASEARKKHPGVKEASERATLKLRTLKQAYVSAVRESSNDSNVQHPTTQLFQSSDLLHPFLLAANYPNATNALLEISFRAMKLLMEANAVVPSDGLNMVRVWTIQAQVVTTYYQKQYSKELKKLSADPTAAEDEVAAEAPETLTSSSSWFSWASSSSSATKSNNTLSTLPHETPSKLSTKSAVSSSSGQTGTGSQSPQVMEKLALEILSCLLRLLEGLKAYPESLSVEIWNNATSLACLWLYNVPNRHKVQQAAQSTTVQVLELLYQTNSAGEQKFSNKLVSNTWEDLLTLATAKKATFVGAFSLCERSAATATPPTPDFALELMSQLWRDSGFRPEYSLMIKTFSVTMGLLERMSKLTAERSLRTLQWCTVLFQTQSSTYTNECRELFNHMIKPIILATDACRSHHDFEDGFVYASKEIWLEKADSEESGSINSGAGRRHEGLASFFPPLVLWKSGFALESIYTTIEREESFPVLFDDVRLVSQLAEALSHFATIGASCRDHMLQVVDFCEMHVKTNQKPTMMRTAEVAILSGNASALTATTTSGSKSKDKSNHMSGKHNLHSTIILGESIFFAMQSMLRIAANLKQSENAEKLLEETFAPFLGILQHYMKRFAGSSELVRLSLMGYTTLADVCLPLESRPLQRKALLTSLSKLSLPSWGKRDPSSQLSAHHIRSLICLLKIVHLHYESITSDWELILWTFEELSVMQIASPQLSDEDYHAALTIAAIFSRFAPFSTCFTDSGVMQIVETLTDICESTMGNRDIVGDSDTILPDLSLSQDHGEKTADGRSGTISGKIMSMGVKAIYGNASSEEAGKAGTQDVSMQRTKQVYYEEYRKSFVAKLSSSKHTVRTESLGRVPFVLTLLSDIVVTNSFRSKECLEVFSTQLSRLAASTPAVRPFAMDIMSLLIMTQLSDDEAVPFEIRGSGRVLFNDPMLSQLLASEPIKYNYPLPSRDASHSDVITPLCKTIRSNAKAEVTESAGGALFMILQGSGHLLQPDVWPSILEAVSSMSGDPSYGEDRSGSDWAACGQIGFRCFKLIVDDYLDELPPLPNSEVSVVEHVLKCCCSFVSSRHGINTSLTAIGLLWTIADKDANPKSVDMTLAKLVLLSSDDRAEVRNAAVNTMFSCIVGRGGTFSPLQWKSCFLDTVSGVYDIVASHIGSSDASNGPRAPRAKVSEQKSRYQVNLHHSRDSASKQWIGTQVLVIRGVTRVLRSFFKELLEAVEADLTKSDSDSWLEEEWNRILELAWDAASQEGDRESLDVRSTGVELLGVCCLLASKSGIQAASSPARVGTNMEVVNGALRSVRETTTRTTVLHTHSDLSLTLKRKLFVEAFKSLESFHQMVVKKADHLSFPNDTDSQILHRFLSTLAKVYECCKNDEFSLTNDALEGRFLTMVLDVLSVATKSDVVRYLNQPQRCAIDVLRSMASNGSLPAFRELVGLARGSFFVRKDQDADESETGEDSFVSHSALHHEAATVVSEEILQENLSDESKVLILDSVFSAFFSDFGNSTEFWRKRHFKRFVPVLDAGLAAASRQTDGQMDELQDNPVWSSLASFLRKSFSLVDLGKDMTKIPRVSELLEIIEVAIPRVPKYAMATVCESLVYGISNALGSATKHASFAAKHASSDIGRKSKRHQDELLGLFRVAFDHSCRLAPESQALRSVSEEALLAYLNAEKEDPALDVLVLTSKIVCEHLVKHDDMQTLVIALFPLLSRLLAGDNEELKTGVGAIFQAIDIGSILERLQTRCHDAEARAARNEAEVTRLRDGMEALTATNTRLRREVALLEACTALPS